MNDRQKQQIEVMRRKGHGSADIAKTLGLPVNTVKSYLRRKQDTPVSGDLCRNCGKRLVQNPRAREKSFCSSHCRQTWWNSNRDQVQHRDARFMECANCGREFEAHGKRQRKYCSSACCAADRGSK